MRECMVLDLRAWGSRYCMECNVDRERYDSLTPSGFAALRCVWAIAVDSSVLSY